MCLGVYKSTVTLDFIMINIIKRLFIKVKQERNVKQIDQVFLQRKYDKTMDHTKID